MIRAVALAAGFALLAGCGGEQEELRGWMDEVRKSTPTTVPAIAPPRHFEPFRYENVAQIDPFSVAKMNAMMARSGVAKGGLAPDLRRVREVLENYTLDQIRLVGHLRRGVQQTALVEVDKLIYQLRVGNHAGQDFGRVTRITENAVTLRELVQDASGEWVERETMLQLQERKP